MNCLVLPDYLLTCFHFLMTCRLLLNAINPFLYLGLEVATRIFVFGIYEVEKLLSENHLKKPVLALISLTVLKRSSAQSTHVLSFF